MEAKNKYSNLDGGWEKFEADLDAIREGMLKHLHESGRICSIVERDAHWLP